MCLSRRTHHSHALRRWLFGIFRDERKCRAPETKLSGDFIMKNVGILSSFLRIEISWQKDTVRLRKKWLIKWLLDDNNNAECKPMNTPMKRSADARKPGVNRLNNDDASRNHSIVVNLLYIAIKTHSGLCLAASSPGLHVERPHEYDMIADIQAL